MNKFKYIKVLNNRQIRYLSKEYKDNLYIVFLHGFMSSIESEKPQAILKFAKTNKQLIANATIKKIARGRYSTKIKSIILKCFSSLYTPKNLKKNSDIHVFRSD